MSKSSKQASTESELSDDQWAVFAAFGLFVTVGIGVCAAVAFQALVVLVLWNALVPVLFGGAVITYWHGVLIALVIQIAVRIIRSTRSTKK